MKRYGIDICPECGSPNIFPDGTGARCEDCEFEFNPADYAEETEDGDPGFLGVIDRIMAQEGPPTQPGSPADIEETFGGTVEDYVWQDGRIKINYSGDPTDDPNMPPFMIPSALALAGWLEAAGVPNGITIELGEGPRRVSFTVQWIDGKTPIDIMAEQEARIKELEARLKR